MISLFYLICNLTAVGSLMAFAVLLLRAMMGSKVKKSLFVFLWLVVFCRFCIPFSIASPLSILNVTPFSADAQQGTVMTSSPDYIGS